jgi:Mrp family chromosome partitioning ATPase/capsular polysaccharide biosynthesis protein
MTRLSSETEGSLRERLRVLYRRKRIVAGTFVIVAAATVGFTLHQQRLYTANAQVLLSNQNLASALTNTEQFTGITVTPTYVAQTQADVARSPQLARLTLRTTNFRETPAAFLANSAVSPLAGANLLVFSVSDPAPAKAQALASAYAQQYVSFSQGIATAALVRARQELQTAMASNVGNKSLHAQFVAKDQQLATLEALETSTATLVSTGSAAVQTQPKALRNIAAGIVIGLVLGIGLASLWDVLDARARTSEEIEELLGAPILGSLAAPPRRMYEHGELAMLADPSGASAEAFRILRTQVDLARLGRDCRTIMVTSCVSGEGKSTTVANLAVAMAAAGHRVAAVDLDLRGAQLHRFMAPRGPTTGITGVALGDVELDDALVRVTEAVPVGSVGARPVDGHGGADDLDVEAQAVLVWPYADPAPDESLMFLPAGVAPPSPGEFSDSAGVGLILTALRARFDTVLIDTPPAMAVGDALALSQRVDAVLVVARVDLVGRPLLKQLKRRLAASPATLMGVIVTGVRRQRRAYPLSGSIPA